MNISYANRNCVRVRVSFHTCAGFLLKNEISVPEIRNYVLY